MTSCLGVPVLAWDLSMWPSQPVCADSPECTRQRVRHVTRGAEVALSFLASAASSPKLPFCLGGPVRQPHPRPGGSARALGQGDQPSAPPPPTAHHPNAGRQVQPLGPSPGVLDTLPPYLRAAGCGTPVRPGPRRHHQRQIQQTEEAEARGFKLGGPRIHHA